MAGMVFFDLDGVLRDLQRAVWKGDINGPAHWDEPAPNGQSFYDYVNDRLHVLEEAGPTEYLEVAKKVRKLVVLTVQPKAWRAGTEKWMMKYVGRPGLMHTQFFDSPEEKLGFVMSRKERCLIVEDYPFFEDYSKVVLVDRRYNKKVMKPYVRIEHPAQLARILEQEKMV